MYFWVLPVLGADFAAAYPEFARCYWPWLIFLWLTAVPCYITLFFGWSIAAEIGRDNSFSVKNAVSLRNIALLAAGDAAVLSSAGNVLYLFPEHEPPRRGARVLLSWPSSAWPSPRRRPAFPIWYTRPPSCGKRTT